MAEDNKPSELNDSELDAVSGGVFVGAGGTNRGGGTGGSTYVGVSGGGSTPGDSGSTDPFNASNVQQRMAETYRKAAENCVIKKY